MTDLRPHACEVCDGLADWRMTRRGDASTTWACDDHFGTVARRLQRPEGGERLTELVVTVNTVNVLTPDPDFGAAAVPDLDEASRYEPAPSGDD